MNNEIIVDENIVIEKAGEVLDRINCISLSKELSDLSDVITFIKTEKYTKFYLDNEMNIKCESSKEAMYLWLDTGLVTLENEAIFISLLRKEDGFIGHFVGVAKSLSGNIIEYNKKAFKTIIQNLRKFKAKYTEKIEARENKRLLLDGQNNEEVPSHDSNILKNQINSYVYDITAEVEHELLINNWNSENGLSLYLKTIGHRLITLTKQSRSEFYVLNNIKSAVVNTGLLNRFGEDILILYRYNAKYEIYDAYKIMESKSDFISNGFSKEQASTNLKPIDFLDGEVFASSNDEIDFNNRALIHIIEERRHRFPENLQEVPDSVIAGKIKEALNLAILMHQRDRNYIKALYSCKNNGISWIVPLHINTSLSEKPELVLILRKQENFYEVKTILEYNGEVKDRIQSLSLYSQLW